MLLKNWLKSIKGFLLLACGFFGIFFILAGSMSIWDRYKTKTYIAREAIITQSKLVHYHGHQKKGVYADIQIRFTDQSDTDDIQQQVSVANARYMGIGREQIQQVVENDIARYPVGRIVTVYQNPKYPKRAVLERPAWQERLDLIGIGLFLLMIPFGVRYLKKRRKVTS